MMLAGLDEKDGQIRLNYYTVSYCVLFVITCLLVRGVQCGRYLEHIALVKRFRIIYRAVAPREVWRGRSRA
jgi:hypothetical protein